MDTVYWIIILVLSIALVLFCMILGNILRTGAENGVHAITNAMKREQEKKNPPKPENLADRYSEIK